MSMEYYAATTALGVNPNGVLSSYKDDKKLERDDLPPLIPEGDIINLGKKGADTTRNRSIWTLASTQDTTYWPINVESNNDVTTTADGATTAVDAFNRDQSCSVDAPCFNHWRIPNGIELKALVSDDCKVDQTTSQFPAGCKPIANGAVGSPNVVTVLAGLDPTDVTWTGVFCNGRSVKPIPVSCVTPPDQHTFIWTTDRRSHNTDCGYHVGLFGIHYPVYSRIYSLRVGLALDSTNVNSEWPIYPTMPPQIPGYGAWDSTLAHTKCDQYTRTQIPLATNKGIVLVTDNTDMVDFMAQPGNAALQDTTARKVAEQAAADARRYGRHHRGRFSGLTLHRLRDDVPEARSGEPAYLVAAHAIDQGTGFTVTARAEGTDDSFTISDRPSGAVLHGCTRVHGGAGRHGCQHVKRGHGRW
jgi:hypothetical protein